MCGITGVYSFDKPADGFLPKVQNAVKALYLRGPDTNGLFHDKKIILGHSRLSIIDTSAAANQPFADPSGRYIIVFNGEIFNFKELKERLIQKGTSFVSNSDTEVILQLFIRYGTDFLNRLNGFFAFAIYDKRDDILFIARDRYGVKPLLVFNDNEKIIFASEMKAMLCYDLPKEIDYASLYTYVQLNYTTSPDTILVNIKKLEPGHYLLVKNSNIEQHQYYSIHKNYLYFENNIDSKLPEFDYQYQNAISKLKKLLDSSVRRRLIADVPLGAFLSGGIDSSVIVSIASKYTNNLKTFSIGYKDEPLFDETHYADLVAKKFNTDHTVFKLSNDDLFEHFYDILNYIDEPFADSSAIAVYILSYHTRKHVTVAISGDGADEMFGGYIKHKAEYFVRNNFFKNKVISNLDTFINLMPQSRNSKLGNVFRQLSKLSEGTKLNNKERYWRWCGYQTENEASQLILKSGYESEYKKRQALLLKNIFEHKSYSLNDVFYSDMNIVLKNDMLTKVDLMSMANSLEVRTPFLDYELVDFAFTLPSNFKIDNKFNKKILKDAYRNELPEELYNRKKHGFEVPLLKWFRTELKSKINEHYLEDNFIKKQNIFNPDKIFEIKNSLFKSNNGDIVPQVWALIVFQNWYMKYFEK